MFPNQEASHAHSRKTLDILYEHDDFMLSIENMVDLGCGQGTDLVWWATRTTRDQNPIPLNIHCTGVDQHNSLSLDKRYSNIVYQQCDFEKTVPTRKNSKYDLLWCHDSFQYAVNPINTLSNWWDIASPNAMLALTVPQTTNIKANKHDFYQHSGCYYNHTLVSLIHMLSVSGWDCGSGFFLKPMTEPWLYAVVYRSTQAPMDPAKTSWYDLLETNLLPKTAEDSVKKYGFLRQQDLTLPWLDKNLYWYGNQ